MLLSKFSHLIMSIFSSIRQMKAIYRLPIEYLLANCFFYRTFMGVYQSIHRHSNLQNIIIDGSDRGLSTICFIFMSIDHKSKANSLF